MPGVPAAHFDCAVFERFIPIGDEQIDVDFVAKTKPAAFGTRTVGIVERKQSGSKFLETQIAIGTSVLGGIKHLFAVKIGNHKSFGKFDCVFDCVGYAPLRSVLDDDTVDNHAYVVLHVFVEFYFFVEGIVCSVNSHTHVTCTLKLFEFFAIFALSASDDGRDELQLCALSFHNFVTNLIHRLTLDFTSAFWAMWRAYSCKKQAEIIVDFRHRTDGGARIVRGGFLVD